MGVPKFYRWISERYPCLSEVVKEYQIPEFDNLYFDMNGIIHNCSHPNDEDPHFRITEEQIFLDIFHYIEFLFRIIKPRKVFFMAVDGVAPRAKMNQQRGRRFRTAREAQAKEAEALQRGETLPSEERFDSNCITPGTEFMTRLNEQLKYFISAKISTDKTWQGIKIYLSGHETPGEGEHKIMDYIRHQKSQADYDPNTKHCLYGLDADLIMLGLCSHEPHFSLLREEVKFGKNQKKTSAPERITFHLLHLTLMREYLEHEFSSLKNKLDFPFDIESIIDDWVLMGFLVGNDFIPNIPQMHIKLDALPVLYQSYIEVLPTLGGYINEQGMLNLQRFQIYLNKLSQIDREMFGDVSADIKYLETKCSRKKWGKGSDQAENGLLEGLGIMEGNLISHPGAVGKLVDIDEPEDESDVDTDDSESLAEMEFVQHKRDYYITKMDYTFVDQSVLKEQAYAYVRAIQWNLHYYYNGIVSWSWYYPHHYAPYISDVTDFADMDLTFDYAKPFLPFEQLLAVLPAASKKLLPVSYQKLMVDETSPLKHYYPEDFQTDLNGKQQDWEAVVLIPFIDEKVLLESMKPLSNYLNEDEKRRNSHGPHMLFTHSTEQLGSYISTMPDTFPNLSFNHAHCQEIPLNGFMLARGELKKGLSEGVRLDVYIPGFPTLRHIEHTAELRKAKVKVFQMTSRGENMVLSVTKKSEHNMEEAAGLIGKTVYINWPHLTEAKVNGVSDGETWIDDSNENNRLSNEQKVIHRGQCSSITQNYAERFGVKVGDINVLVRVNILTGKRFVVGINGKVTIEKIWANYNSPAALQTIVKDIEFYQSDIENFKTIDELFSHGTTCFMLGQPCYGCIGEVLKSSEASILGKVEVKFKTPKEPNLDSVTKLAQSLSTNHYQPGFAVARKLGINGYLLSRLTGTFFVQTNSLEAMNAVKINIGLNLKFNRRNEEIPGYSKKGPDDQWLYSGKALEVMSEYLSKFPELFDNILTHLNDDIAHVDDLFPNGKGAAYIKEVKTWLEAQPCTSQTRQACGANILDPAIVAAIEKTVDESNVQNKQPASLTISVKPEFLYRPHTMHGSSSPDSKATYQLYDRVVNIRQGSTVPLGLRGTVIGVHSGDSETNTNYDVVFDSEFVGGLSLNCSFKRGYRLHSCALINLTHGARKISKKSTVIDNLQGQQSLSGKRVKIAKSRLYSQAVSSITHDAETFEDRHQSSPKKNQMTILQNKSSSKQQVRNRSQTQNENVSKKNSKMQASERANEQSTPEPSAPNQFNHSPDSPFVPHNIARSADLFTFESPTFETQNTTPINFRTEQQQQQNSASQPTKLEIYSQEHNEFSKEKEFMSLWNELKLPIPGQSLPNTNNSNVIPPSEGPTRFPPPPQIPLNNENVYGKQISVTELLEKARSAECQNVENPSRLLSQQQAKFCPSVELENFLRIANCSPPHYIYNRSGAMSLVTAVLTLSNGKTFFSNPCHNVEAARESAAEQALVSLKSESTCIVPNAYSLRPSFPPPFSGSAIQNPPSFPTPVVSLSMAANSLPRLPTDYTISRKRAPSVSSQIPDSFVEYNKQLVDHFRKQDLLNPQASTVCNSYDTENNKPVPLDGTSYGEFNTEFAKRNIPGMKQWQNPPRQPLPHSLPNYSTPPSHVIPNYPRAYYSPPNPVEYQHKPYQHQQQQQNYNSGSQKVESDNWSRGWQSESPKKSQGRVERTPNRNSERHSNLGNHNSQSPIKQRQQKTDDSQTGNITATRRLKKETVIFVPAQVARRQAGTAKANESKESNQQALIDRMNSLQVTNSNNTPQALHGATSQSSTVVSHKNGPPKGTNKKKSRLAVNFPKSAEQKIEPK